MLRFPRQSSNSVVKIQGGLWITEVDNRSMRNITLPCLGLLYGFLGVEDGVEESVDDGVFGALGDDALFAADFANCQGL